MTTTKYWAALLATCALFAGCDGGGGGTDAGSDDDAQVQPECTDGTTLCGEACVSTATNREHCGACDQACEQGEVCTDGACAIVCPVGQEVCDGACVDTGTNRAHCGACGTACADGERCVDGACELSCPDGQTVCGGACVDTNSNVAHCGSCDSPCDPGQVCDSGSCAATCSAGLIDCGGACVDVQHHPDHCGGCDTPCAGTPGGSGVCAAGACRTVCDALYGDCNADLATDGCETPLATDPASCGACGRTCSFPSAVAGCTGGACTIAMCLTGTGDCDGDLTNGCETDVSADEFSCGSCGTVCAAGEECISGACMPVVADDCSSVVALTDGTNSVGWMAYELDYLTTRPSCTSSALAGPDIVLSYTATTTGAHTFTITPPTSTRWAMVASTDPCGTVSPTGDACASQFGSAMVLDPFLTAGQTVHLYVADTTSGAMPLSSPLPVDVAAPSCATPVAPSITALDPVSGSTTSTLSPSFRVTFDAPVHDAVGTITITGDMGTSLSYDLSTSPSQVTFDATRTTMTINPGITFPSAEHVTIGWTGLIGRACGTAVPPPASWTVDIICLAAYCATCTDGVANGAETDVDCGGTSTCPRCADGQLCPNGPSDCLGPYCEAGRCGCRPGFTDCDSDVGNGCETNTATDELNCGGCGTTCPAGESCNGGICSLQGTGESCSSPWILVPGANTVAWTATAAEYLTTTPSCVLVGTVTGPDLVLTYTATTSGSHRLDFDKPTDTRWVALVSTEACGTTAPSLACISDWAPATMGGAFTLSAGQTVYVYVSDTTSGTLPLDNPISVTLTVP